jgi:hypothetical protein
LEVIQELGPHAKAGVFVVAFYVVAVEAYLLVEDHDRNHGYSATSGILATNVAAPEEVTPRDRSGSAGSTSPDARASPADSVHDRRS